jgi:hypothetical protein
MKTIEKIGLPVIFLLFLIAGVVSYLTTPIKGTIVKAGVVIEGPAFIREDTEQDKILLIGEGEEYLTEGKVTLFYSQLSNKQVEAKMIKEGWELY